MKIKADIFTVVTAVVFLFAAMFIGSVLLSNKGGVNLHHRHHINLASSAVSTKCSGFFSKTCHIVFNKDIVKSESYNDLVTLLYSARADDKIYLYFTGNGGYVDTALMLNTAIKKSKALTITVITGDVYSAHALLGVSGKRIIVKNEHAIIMFHRSSIYSIKDPVKYCNKKYKGQTDRRQSLVGKCIKYMYAYIRQDSRAVLTLYKGILTKKEIQAVLAGHDVFLTGYELKKRLEK